MLPSRRLNCLDNSSDMGKEGSAQVMRHATCPDELTNTTKQSLQKKSHQSRYSNPYLLSSKAAIFHAPKNDHGLFGAHKPSSFGRRRALFCKHLRLMALVFILMALFSWFDSLVLSVIHHLNTPNDSTVRKSMWLKDEKEHDKRFQISIYGRLLNSAFNAPPLIEERKSSKLWEEPVKQEFEWKPCLIRHNHVYQGHGDKRTGYILVSANGGLNQQRVAVCNAVAVAVLLNASLVLPKFLYSSVWRDASQFSDIYQEDYFIDHLKDDVNIVKELPLHLQSLNFEAIGSQITDADIMKESGPSDFLKAILPILQRNEVVHFLGFGNRLGFDPLPSYLQNLRCKCNFRALKFVPKIQEIGSLLVRRIRSYNFRRTEIDRQLLGKYMRASPLKPVNVLKKPTKYLALHLRFEMDMVAYSLCDFGGGESERKELQAYRDIHFPRLVAGMGNNSISPDDLRKNGKCPLTPEEVALVLSALGFNSQTYVYLAGSHIYGGPSRMQPLTTLFPNLVTKEDLLAPSELAPFRNFSSQLAAMDFIVCAAADVFAMTDSGSQLSSLVSGYRIYHGRGHAPTIRPNKKSLANILLDNSNIEWSDFVERVKNMIYEDQQVYVRRRGQSIYRHPRSPGCMCKV